MIAGRERRFTDLGSLSDGRVARLELDDVLDGRASPPVNGLVVVSADYAELCRLLRKTGD